MRSANISRSRLIIQKSIFNILILIIALIFTSCEKDDVPLGTMSVTVDGSNKSFNHYAKAEWITVQGGYGLLINSYKGEVGSSNQISITVVSSRPIAAMTYNDHAYGDLVEIKYYVNLIFFWDEFTSSTATVTISEINSTHVKGTFSGKLQDSGGSTREFSKGAYNISF